MRALTLAVAGLAAVILAAFGAAGVGPGAYASPSPGPSVPPVPSQPSHGFDVVVSDQDRAVQIHVGQRIEVFLRARTGMTAWSGVHADDGSVLVAVPTGLMAVRGATIAGFLAVGPGVAQVTAYATPQCGPDQACPMYAMLFSLQVTVVP